MLLLDRISRIRALPSCRLSFNILLSLWYTTHVHTITYTPTIFRAACVWLTTMLGWWLRESVFDLDLLTHLQVRVVIVQSAHIFTNSAEKTEVHGSLQPCVIIKPFKEFYPHPSHTRRSRILGNHWIFWQGMCTRLGLKSGLL